MQIEERVARKRSDVGKGDKEMRFILFLMRFVFICLKGSLTMWACLNRPRIAYSENQRWEIDFIAIFARMISWLPFLRLIRVPIFIFIVFLSIFWQHSKLRCFLRYFCTIGHVDYIWSRQEMRCFFPPSARILRHKPECFASSFNHLKRSTLTASVMNSVNVWNKLHTNTVRISISFSLISHFLHF